MKEVFPTITSPKTTTLNLFLLEFPPVFLEEEAASVIGLEKCNSKTLVSELTERIFLVFFFFFGPIHYIIDS
jgi:hypothetical protein